MSVLCDLYIFNQREFDVWFRLNFITVWRLCCVEYSATRYEDLMDSLFNFMEILVHNLMLIPLK